MLADYRITERRRRERVASASPKIKASYLPASETWILPWGIWKRRKPLLSVDYLTTELKLRGH